MQQRASFFTQFAKHIARASGHPSAFASAIFVLVVWAATGPGFRYSDTWQLVINTGTTIVTFVMVFLIQNTQNRESEAMQIKLDEIIRSIKGAQNSLLDLEELSDDELERVHKRYEHLAQQAREKKKRRSAHKNKHAP